MKFLKKTINTIILNLSLECDLKMMITSFVFILTIIIKIIQIITRRRIIVKVVIIMIMMMIIK